MRSGSVPAIVRGDSRRTSRYWFVKREDQMAKRVLCIVCLLFFAGFSSINSKMWQGIEPGTSKKTAVLAKFGQPTRIVPATGGEVLAYFGEQAIRGTRQVQFQISGSTGRVTRIDVFPRAVIDKNAVEATYGPRCTSATGTNNCYVKKLTDDFKVYFQYNSTGLTVFFNEDGMTVQKFVYHLPR